MQSFFISRAQFSGASGGWMAAARRALCRIEFAQACIARVTDSRTARGVSTNACSRIPLYCLTFSRLFPSADPAQNQSFVCRSSFARRACAAASARELDAATLTTICSRCAGNNIARFGMNAEREEGEGAMNEAVLGAESEASASEAS